MAVLSIERGMLKLELSLVEKLGSVRLSDPSFPVATIKSVQRLENSRDGIRGLRSPGTGWPGRIALGYWRTFKTVDFVAVYGNEPGYLIELDTERLDRLVVSSPVVPGLDARM